MQTFRRYTLPGILVLVANPGFVIPPAVADLTDNVEYCDSCHGDDGVSSESDVPSIAGVSAFIIEEYMFEYRDDARPCRESEFRSGDTERPATDMCAIAREFDEAAISEMAGYYGDKDFVAASQDFDASKAALGAKIHRKSCEKCHSDGGSYADDDAGILAGQWMPYLDQVFADYAAGERGMMETKMKDKIDELDAESIAALVHYYGSLQ